MTSNKRKQVDSEKKRPNESHVVLPSDINDSVFSESLKTFEAAFEKAFSKNRDFYVNSIVTRFKALGLGRKEITSQTKETEWIEIDSLSKLRGVVGGRFQNIKMRWTGAGFPLKEHRGDKTASYDVDQSGWIELTNWILGQGFEARLADNGAEFLFEIRPVSNSSR